MPLDGEWVAGLHVLEHLQVLTRAAISAKGPSLEVA
jgi:hypothetical protein